MKEKRNSTLSRREFFQKTAKGALALGCLSAGLSGACAKSKRLGVIGKKLSVIDMSRVSTCSIALNHLPAEEAFPIIAAAGHRKVDVHEKVHFLIFEDLCDYQELKATADKNGLLIANLATYLGGGLYGRNMMYAFHDWQVPHAERFTRIGFSSDDPADQGKEFEQMKRMIDVASFFGSRSIRVFPGNDDPATFDRMVPWFKRSAEYAAERNVYLAFENEGVDGEGISGTPELCAELSEKVGSPFFGVLYEPGNLMANGTDYRSALQTMKDYVVHCHFKDGKPVGDKYEMQHFGEGVIDFPWIVEQLDANGYEGEFALEFEMYDPPPEIGVKKFHDDFAALFDKAINL